MFYLNSTLNFGIPPILLFQLKVYCKVDRLLTGLTAQPKGTNARLYSNKTSLIKNAIKKFPSKHKVNTYIKDIIPRISREKYWL